MSGQAKIPAELDRFSSVPYLLGLIGNPLVTTRRLHRKHGGFAILRYPQSLRKRQQLLPCVSDAELYQSIASDAEIWRPVNVSYRGFKSHASHRLAAGMPRMRGPRAAHYRRLIMPLLSPRSIRENSSRIAEIAEAEISSWPTGEVTDLLPLVEHLMQDLAVAQLFGDDRADALPAAKMISLQWAAGWFAPGPSYLAWMRVASKQELAILQWAAKKRGNLDPKNLLSIIVNTPNESGLSPSRAILGGFLTFTFGAAYETSKSAVDWTLILLSQHPQIASQLAEEVTGALHGDLSMVERIDSLPLLNGVVKEAMRLFPPVPIQFRRSTAETELGAATFKAGVRVCNSIHLINRDPELYTEPDRFRPQRWHGLQPSPYQYPVFGAGPRMCAGFLMGDQLVKLAVAAVVSRYRVEMRPRARLDYRSKITLLPSPRVPVIFRGLASAPVVNRPTGRVHQLVDLAVSA